MRPSFENVIHIEGMDLAGKSTATKVLGMLFSATVTRNSLVDKNEIYDAADNLRRTTRTSPTVLGHLYVAALARDLELIRRPSALAIQDSTILLRSTAYYRVLGDQRLVDAFTAMSAAHPRFGTSIVLTATIEARLARLEMRLRINPEEIADDDLAVKRDPDRFLAMEGALITYADEWFGAHIIDTSDLSPEEVIGRVIACLPRKAV